jgi:hypothetical protein
MPTRRRGALPAREVAALSYARRRRIRARTSEWIENKVANCPLARGAMSIGAVTGLTASAGGDPRDRWRASAGVPVPTIRAATASAR